ncbi:16S rRNA (cytidine(1402)-2'-O)-methyltransferase [hydrothermal vent metagenome]|uniref:16S rRNA (Cytidine(1402)-2'-O)-methyltransferase n=1 Tax=hydrothermal vent metagenome TaxID=652676 RepID=A0A3B0XR21_9ZZZZ
MNQGTLYIVATPIGNRSDMSARAVEVLKQVDLIAAEDTRNSAGLMQLYAITTPMLAYHDHNEEQMTPRLIQRLQSGESVALVSDAGTPLMSDPGYRLVKAAHESSIQVSPLPGACAAIAALSACGLATDRFLFAGFAPHKQVARQRFFEEFVQQSATLVFYESSHRIVASVSDMQIVYGHQRQVTMAREISKTFETIHKCTLGELPGWLQADKNQQKGEFVIVLEGATIQVEAQMLELESILEVLLTDLSVRQAAQMAAKITGAKKNTAYKLALEISASG